jgi:hypothetical protein
MRINSRKAGVISENVFGILRGGFFRMRIISSQKAAVSSAKVFLICGDKLQAGDFVGIYQSL